MKSLIKSRKKPKIIENNVTDPKITIMLAKNWVFKYLYSTTHLTLYLSNLFLSVNPNNSTRPFDIKNCSNLYNSLFTFASKYFSPVTTFVVLI